MTSKTDELYGRVLADWHERLRDGNWISKKTLIESTSAELCDEYNQTSSSSVLADLDNPHELAWARFERDVLPRLLAEDDYEDRTQKGQVEIRCCTPKAVTKPAAAVDLKSTPKDTSSAATSTNPASGPPAQATGLPSATATRPDTNTSGSTASAPVVPVKACQARIESFGNASVRLVDPDLPIHELANLIPATGPDDYQRIVEDMRSHGQQVPAWTHEGRLLDGRTRMRAARELGLQLVVQEWNGSGSLLGFVLSLNLHRRHLSESQRAMVAAKIKPLFAEEARQRMLAGVAADPMSNSTQGPARDQAGEMLNVGPSTVESASKILKEGDPDLVAAVEKGEVSVAAGADLTALPPAEQKRALRGGKTTVKAKVQELRQQKAKARSQARKAEPNRKEAAKSVEFNPATNDTGDDDTLTIHKPTTTKERQALANLMWERLGPEECQALALVWATKATKDKASEKPKLGAKVKRGTQPKPAAKGKPDPKTQPDPKAKPPVKQRRSGPVLRPRSPQYRRGRKERGVFA